MKELMSPRDVLLLATGHGDVWVSAVDSCGGIGKEAHDTLQVDPIPVGMLTARVALLEVMAVGAKPAFASIAVSNGPDAAEPLICGAKKMLGEHLPCIISTEKNMPTSMTGFGITVTGLCKMKDLLTARAKPGDTLYCVGTPLVGGETLDEKAKLFGVKELEILLKNPHVHAIIPVGSKGIAAEAGMLAAENGLQFQLNRSPAVDLNKSAGPSTCAVCSADRCTDWGINLPIFEIGILLHL